MEPITSTNEMYNLTEKTDNNTTTEKAFWVDFSGYVKIIANTPEEAERHFWNYFVNNACPVFCCDDCWDIECVEEIIN